MGDCHSSHQQRAEENQRFRVVSSHGSEEIIWSVAVGKLQAYLQPTENQAQQCRDVDMNVCRKM